MCVSIRYVHLVLKRQQPINSCSEEHYCVILQLITFLHLNTSVTDFISKFMLYSSTLVIVLVLLLTLLVQLVVFAVV